MNQRIRNLRKSFEKEKIEALWVTNPINIRYLTGFAGLAPTEREADVLVTNNDCYLITDSRYIEQAKQIKHNTLKFKFKDWQKNARAFFCPLTVREIKPKENIAKLLNDLIVKLKIKRLGFEAKDFTFSEYQKLKRIKCTKTADGRGSKWYKFSLVPTKDLVENLRATKTPEEIKKIRKAVKITDQCFEYLLKFLRPRLTEKEIAWEIEKFIKEKGAELAFKPIVASGPNSSIPHHIPSKTYKLKPRTLVLLDFGAKVDGYCSDMTRVVFLGKATEAQKKIYISVLKEQKKALSFLTQNLKVKTIEAKEIDKVARNYLKNSGFPEIPHGLGHGVGLSEHEKPSLSPKSKDVLKPSMVFTVEPGVYLPGKFGIRIEDLVLLKKDKVEILTETKKEIVEL